MSCELRKEAIAQIHARGWVIGSMGVWNASHNNDGPLCILGALWVAAVPNRDDRLSIGLDNTRRSENAYNHPAVVQACKDMGLTVQSQDGTDDASPAWQFNDGHGKGTREAVLERLSVGCP